MLRTVGEKELRWQVGDRSFWTQLLPISIHVLRKPQTIETPISSLSGKCWTHGAEATPNIARSVSLWESRHCGQAARRLDGLLLPIRNFVILHIPLSMPTTATICYGHEPLPCLVFVCNLFSPAIIGINLSLNKNQVNYTHSPKLNAVYRPLWPKLIHTPSYF